MKRHVRLSPCQGFIIFIQTRISRPVPQSSTSQRFASLVPGGCLYLSARPPVSSASQAPLPHKLNQSHGYDVISWSEFQAGVGTLTECKFFERLMGRLWEHKVHKDHLEREPDTITDVESPAGVINTNWVDKLIEEASHTAKPLEYRNAFSADMEWKEFDK